jgi:hypothetical protein
MLNETSSIAGGGRMVIMNIVQCPKGWSTNPSPRDAPSLAESVAFVGAASASCESGTRELIADYSKPAEMAGALPMGCEIW